VGDPTWNGDDIIFLQKTSSRAPKQIFTVNKDGSGAATLVDKGPASRPDWCDAGGLMFLRTAPDHPNSGTITIRSGPALKHIHSLSKLGAQVRSATWSPTCKQIAYIRMAGNPSIPTLFITDASGNGTSKEIPLPSGYAANQAAWGSR
jgi:hypothetical protein